MNNKKAELALSGIINDFEYKFGKQYDVRDSIFSFYLAQDAVAKNLSKKSFMKFMETQYDDAIIARKDTSHEKVHSN
ncbi:MAG: hypothetical protein SOH70_03990 [Lentilactobacillus sunkii]|jgi:hypothetical protein|uniref:hypothetical protein n=1 Tax=Lentilactobacillus sunkii TaxID=481719 RepID=UPI002F34F4D1